MADAPADGRAAQTIRHAFTVIELLVVLAVVAVLCMLVLPAVQRAREAARQVQCRNQLHQIGLALHSYHAAEQCFPSGWILAKPVSESSENGWGWPAMLLPRLEQAELFHSINFAEHVRAESNQTCRLTVLDGFLCPSDHAPHVVPFFRRSGDDREDGGRSEAHTNMGDVMFEVAGSSYVGVFGDHDPDDRPDVHGDGLFGLNSRVRFADIVDGTSHTLAVGERSATRLASTWTGMHPSEEEGPERVVGFAERSPNHPLADEAEFSSRHPVGVHFLFGDGSVRFIGDMVDEVIYRSLATRAGQEAVRSESF